MDDIKNQLDRQTPDLKADAIKASAPKENEISGVSTGARLLGSGSEEFCCVHFFRVPFSAFKSSE